MSAGLLCDSLTFIGLPEALLMEVPGERARPPGDGVRHPIPGWDLVPGSGAVRMWADINLLHWLGTADRYGVTVFGPSGRAQIAALEFGARTARARGAGVRTLWGVDVHAADGWVEVTDLVVYGPALPDDVVAQVSGELDTAGSGHTLAVGPNYQPAEVGYTMTTWTARIA